MVLDSFPVWKFELLLANGVHAPPCTFSPLAFPQDLLSFLVIMHGVFRD